MNSTVELMSGRELDALIHHAAMKVVWDEALCRVCGWRLASHDAVGCHPNSCSLRTRPDGKRADEPPPYSTDLAAAWQVVEKFYGRGLYLTLDNWPFATRSAFRWTAVFRSMELTLGDEAAPTPPLAICRAAIAVLHAEEPA